MIRPVLLSLAPNASAIPTARYSSPASGPSDLNGRIAIDSIAAPAGVSFEARRIAQKEVAEIAAMNAAQTATVSGIALRFPPLIMARGSLDFSDAAGSIRRGGPDSERYASHRSP